MGPRIAVSSGTPTWRRGMAATLTDLGYSPVDVPVLEDWRPGRGGAAVVVHSEDPSDESIVTFAAEHPLIPLVVVTPDLELRSFAAAIGAGASGVIDDSEDLAAFGHVIVSALSDRVSAPRRFIAAMASRIPRDATELLTSDEEDWLRALSEGITVATLAERIGYSERETFRILGGLYTRLGVKNRTEAIVWATRHGVVRPASEAP